MERKLKYKEEGITFDEELCKTIRQNIIRHKENLDKLQKAIDYVQQLRKNLVGSTMVKHVVKH
jgi:hypothetical protein